MTSNGSKIKMEDGQGPQENPKVTEFVKELLNEKVNIDGGQFPNAVRLLDEEVTKTQAKGKVIKDQRYVDIYREKPVRVVVKVLVPVKEHPRFNFVGKLLGPRGNSLKRLQEETMTKMAILGRGSMRDKQKEEECRNTLDPKYSHLTDDLHVEIAALAPPAEAHARIAFALAEIRKYLVPDANDEIRMEQLREIQVSEGPGRGGVGGGRGRGGRGGAGGGGPVRPPIPPMGRGGMAGGAPPMLPRPGPGGPPPPGKSKVLSILDRARAAMEETYDYEEPSYYDNPAPVGPSGYGDNYNGGNGGDYYDSNYQGSSTGRWKSYRNTMGGTGGGESGGRFGARPTPYSRPSK